MVSAIKVVAVGNVQDGISLYGPFWDQESIDDFTDTLGSAQWTVGEVAPPYLSAETKEPLAVGLFVGQAHDMDGETEALVTLWPDGCVELATRANPTHSWGPPVVMESRSVR